MSSPFLFHESSPSTSRFCGKRKLGFCWAFCWRQRFGRPKHGWSFGFELLSFSSRVFQGSFCLLKKRSFYFDISSMHFLVTTARSTMKMQSTHRRFYGSLVSPRCKGSGQFPPPCLSPPENAYSSTLTYIS